MVDVVKLGIKRPASSRPLLPDPEPREVNYTLFSVDDHLMEPAHAFEGRLPAKFQARGPKVVESEEGHEVWQLDGQPYFQVGFLAVAGRPEEDHRLEPALQHWAIEDFLLKRPQCPEALVIAGPFRACVYS